MFLHLLYFQHYRRNEIVESNDGIVLVWGVDESEDFPSLGLIDNCHTNSFTANEFDNVTQYR